MDGLRAHLQKSEIEYIATRGGGYPETFKWQPDICAHLRQMGFRIKEHGETDGTEWVTTTNGVYVSVKVDGMCSRPGFVYKNNRARQK
jgi:hypothetical protein